MICFLSEKGQLFGKRSNSMMRNKYTTKKILKFIQKLFIYLMLPHHVTKTRTKENDLEKERERKKV